MKRGFTLLEILLVIAAIGILAAIVLVAINPNRQINQARQAVINSDKNTIERALQQELIDTGNYPTSVDGLQRKICSSTVTTDCINITGDLVPNYIAEIPSNTTYIVNTSNDRNRVYVNTNDTALNFRCPTGYIRVPGNSMYGTKDFCVMKYEAKTGSATVPATTQATGVPIGGKQDDVIKACRLNGAGYDLINNNEWMTIARNIESQASNWYNPTPTPVNQVGSGGLWRGHSDSSPPTVLAANTNDNLGYEGTGNDILNGWQQRRTHTLSNGEVIWDFSGNRLEFLSDTLFGREQPIGSNAVFTWSEYSSISNYGKLSYDLIRPSNSNWGAAQNMGLAGIGGVSNNTEVIFTRGGSFDGGGIAGVFSFISLYVSYVDYGFGFRCVIR